MKTTALFLTCAALMASHAGHTTPVSPPRTPAAQPAFSVSLPDGAGTIDPSPDGRWLICEECDNGVSLWLCDLRAKRRQWVKIHSGYEMWCGEWRSDSRMYACGVGVRENEPRIGVFSPFKQRVTLVRDGRRRADHPAWALDGRLAFLTEYPSDRTPKGGKLNAGLKGPIYSALAVRAARSLHIRFLRLAANQKASAPIWSPSGKTVAFTNFNNDIGRYATLVDLKTGHSRMLRSIQADSIMFYLNDQWALCSGLLEEHHEDVVVAALPLRDTKARRRILLGPGEIDYQLEGGFPIAGGRFVAVISEQNTRSHSNQDGVVWLGSVQPAPHLTKRLFVIKGYDQEISPVRAINAHGRVIWAISHDSTWANAYTLPPL